MNEMGSCLRPPRGWILRDTADPPERKGFFRKVIPSECLCGSVLGTRLLPIDVAATCESPPFCIFAQELYNLGIFDCGRSDRILRLFVLTLRAKDGGAAQESRYFDRRRVKAGHFRHGEGLGESLQDLFILSGLGLAVSVAQPE